MFSFIYIASFFLVNIGSQFKTVQVKKCGCVGSSILYLLLPCGIVIFLKLKIYLIIVASVCIPTEDRWEREKTVLDTIEN
jgi:hypothetical protein